MEDLTGINLGNEPLHINHASLARVGNSSFRSDCPICKEGLLLVKRDQTTLRLLAEDRCILCGQAFIYDDINNF